MGLCIHRRPWVYSGKQREMQRNAENSISITKQRTMVGRTKYKGCPSEAGQAVARLEYNVWVLYAKSWFRFSVTVLDFRNTCTGLQTYARCCFDDNLTFTKVTPCGQLMPFSLGTLRFLDVDSSYTPQVSDPGPSLASRDLSYAWTITILRKYLVYIKTPCVALTLPPFPRSFLCDILS